MEKKLFEVEEQEDAGIILSDGCRLSSRIWMPKNSEAHPVPAILEYLPYRKRDGTAARDCITHPFIASHGYACVRVDMRGNGDSDGIMEDEYTELELSDGVEIINWLAAQSWCTGKVGMMGISWGGFNSLQIAELAPEPLKAIITLCSTVDRYADDIHYMGGCLLNENLGWGSTMWSYSSRPPDPMLVGDEWISMWNKRLKAEPFLPIKWLKHQTRDNYWKHGSVCENYDGIQSAVLAVGGWGDAYKNAVSHLVSNLKTPVKGIIGPWVHKYPHFAAPEPKIGFLHEALRWWDQWLKGVETGAENDPKYTVYLMDGVRPKAWYSERPGVWVNEDDWPDGPKMSTFSLTENSKLAEYQSTQDLNHIVCSPQDCGLDGGEYCAIWLGPEMPGDQRRDDSYSKCYDSDALTDRLDIIGAPVIQLKIKSDAKSGQVIVRLNHIHPNGASTRITYGCLNLSHRNGHEQISDLVPNELMDIEVILDQIAYRVPEGHKIRVSISNCYWPLLWPMPDNSTLTLVQGKFDLPISSHGDLDERKFRPAVVGEPWKIETLREGGNQRNVKRDLKSGIVTTEIIDDFGKRMDKEHGLITGSIAREWWSIHPDDPLSAHGRTHWTEEIERADWLVRTETYAEMWSDYDTFYLKASLVAFHNGDLVFEKEFNEEIQRLGH